MINSPCGEEYTQSMWEGFYEAQFGGRDGILDITTGKGMAANAGHEHPAVRRAGGNFELVNDLESVTDTGRDV